MQEKQPEILRVLRQPGFVDGRHVLACTLSLEVCSGKNRIQRLCMHFGKPCCLVWWEQLDPMGSTLGMLPALSSLGKRS